MNESDQFVNSYKKKNTKEYYKLCMNKYFKIIKADPNNYFKKKRDYEKDLLTFAEALDIYAPVTAKNYMSIVRNFFIDNDVDISPKFWKRNIRNKLRKAHALTIDRSPSINEMKKILSYADLKTKTLFLTALSSGCRIGELLQLQPDDIDLDSDPCMITVRSTYTKTGVSRITFCSTEAKDHLKAWLLPPKKDELSERDRFVIDACEKIKGIAVKDKNDKRVFPFCDSMTRYMWRKLLKKTGFDKKYSETNRYELHNHSLRKFFLSQMKLDIPETVAEAFAGHYQYLDEAYKRYSRDQLKELYLKGMPRLLVFSTQSEDVKALGDKMQEKDKEMKIMKETIEEMKAQLLELRLEKLEQINGIKKKK